MSDLPILLDEVRRLVVHPGEALAIRVHGRLITQEDAQHIHEVCSRDLPDVHVIVFNGDVELDVIAKEPS